ncbi:hypothetical protein BDZ97DRAFT_1921348 [Flammula alnicola]|nr:hypothetical protein BDZ97DRAFT_1921348 [Flammula alnicola]
MARLRAGSCNTPNDESKTYTETEAFTRTSVTFTSELRRPQASPRSGLASVRNIVALWKECMRAAGRPGEKSAPGSVSSTSLTAPAAENDGLYGIRRRVEGTRARLRESKATSNPGVTPTTPKQGTAVYPHRPGILMSHLLILPLDGQPLMDMLMPFHMLSADGVERLAAKVSLRDSNGYNSLQ